MRSTLSKLHSRQVIIGGGQHKIYIFNLNPDRVSNPVRVVLKQKHCPLKMVFYV
jgi:hypothetical protein